MQDCSGRRLRRAMKLEAIGDEGDAILASSRGLVGEDGEDEAYEDKVLAGEDEKEKLFFRLWKTASTTVTITSFATVRSVTVSASVMCTYPNIELNFC